MKDFAVTVTTPQKVQTGLAYLRNVHETGSWEIAEATEILAELNEEETVIPASTTATVSLKDWAHRCVITPQHARTFYVMLLSKSESFSPDEPWADRYPTGEYLGFQPAPETRWIQNLRHPSYQLRQPIPIVIERSGGACNRQLR